MILKTTTFAIEAEGIVKFSILFSNLIIAISNISFYQLIKLQKITIFTTFKRVIHFYSHRHEFF